MGILILLKYGRNAGRIYNRTLPSASVGQAPSTQFFRGKKSVLNSVGAWKGFEITFVCTHNSLLMIDQAT